MADCDLPIVHLVGGPRERGRAHGEALRAQIVELIERWGDGLEQIYGVDRKVFVERFQAETRYEDTTRRLAPAVLEEVEGIAEGAALEYAQILAFQHVNEEFELGPRFAAEPLDPDGACSTIAVPPTDGQPGLLGQNLDLAQFLDGFQTLLRYPCDRSNGEVMALSVPGMISLMGINSHGFAICDNSLTQLRANPDGLPIYVLYRLLLECRSLEEAQNIIEKYPHAVGLNWVFGTVDGVAMVERSGHEVVRFEPADESRPLYHTNHPLVCADWAERFVDAVDKPQPYRSSYLRLASLHQRIVSAGHERLTVDAVKSILSSRDDLDYPVSRGGGTSRGDQHIGFTLASSVFELREDGPLWHLAAGPGHLAEYRTYGFDQAK